MINNDGIYKFSINRVVFIEYNNKNETLKFINNYDIKLHQNILFKIYGYKKKNSFRNCIFNKKLNIYLFI
jgi:hypothetical protein